MNDSINFVLPTGIRVDVTVDVLSHLDLHRQKSCLRREAGGQLFARISGKKWMVVVATGPRKSDWRSRFGYRPDRRAEKEEIKRHFANGLHFVGDWHTHPEKFPRASDIDINSMDDAVTRSGHQLPGFLLFIVGTSPFPEGLWVSFHYARQPSIVLEPEITENESVVSVGRPPDHVSR